MVAAQASAEDLAALLDEHAEWLVVSETGRTFPVTRNEIETELTDRGMLFGMIGENGFRSRRILALGFDGDEIDVTVAAHFGGEAEMLRLVPRVSAAVLAANVELARLARANEFASLVEQREKDIRIIRVGLNAGSGRFAEIIAERHSGARFAVFADIVGMTTAESMLASSMVWFERLQARANKPARELYIIIEKRSAA